jgi:stage V sporulation protein SpoVS
MTAQKEVKIIRVSGKSPVPQLAGSIVRSYEDGYNIIVRAIGASAVSQMYKGITVARGTLASKGKDLLIKPGFDEIHEVQDDDNEKTVMIAKLVID